MEPQGGGPEDEKHERDEGAFPDWFVESFADYWQSMGSSRIEGRIAAHLMVSDATEGVSAEELAEAAGASRGSVSTYTRSLVARGFVRLVRRPDDRAHYYVMDEDVWAGFLDKEQTYLRSQSELAARALARTTPGGPAHERIRNMRDYLNWLLEVQQLPAAWRRHKAERDAGGS
ncbi:GbsR/MarR family transcriptional regulator [Streptomyces sp. NBC_01451]|uniref:GbsR/MarR family transcriptional regulator n=1 Tax=Streptomyces sp. NBC_01451 TaxID=2903872 RepID=UPI002E30FDEE|nr:MarR family transcriptional regulator [Streptomyces sp. NBC_01451]